MNPNIQPESRHPKLQNPMNSKIHSESPEIPKALHPCKLLLVFCPKLHEEPSNLLQVSLLASSQKGLGF